MAKRPNTHPHAPRVHVIVQNLPVPFDRRVRLECLALIEAGYQVSVVCPKGPGDPKYHVVDGIELYKYRPYPPTTRKLGFVAEYVWSLVMTAWLTAKAWRRHPFDALQACNPPDIFWPIARLLAARGVRFVYDQHDLCPELYESRFPEGPRLLHRALRFTERQTYRAARHVISTNESYRAVALSRGRKKPEDVTVVRTGPDPTRLRPGRPDPSVKRGHRYLAAYIGVMGPQDGVDLLLEAAAHIVHTMGRTDIGFALIGSGDCFAELVDRHRELGLQDHVEFTGRAPDDVVTRIMSTADVGLSPDPKNPLNDVSTMNKTMEYMAFGLPVVAFDLWETRVSAGAAALYAEPNVVERYAEAIVELVDDEARRRSMGAIGRARVENELAWHYQADRYVSVYRDLLGLAATAPAVQPVPARRDVPAGRRADIDAAGRRADRDVAVDALLDSEAAV